MNNLDAVLEKIDAVLENVLGVSEVEQRGGSSSSTEPDPEREPKWAFYTEPEEEPVDVHLAMSKKVVNPDKDIPERLLTEKERTLFNAAKALEWDQVRNLYGAVRLMSVEESERVLREEAHRIMKSRFILARKERKEVRHKARLVRLGQRIIGRDT